MHQVSCYTITVILEQEHFQSFPEHRHIPTQHRNINTKIKHHFQLTIIPYNILDSCFKRVIFVYTMQHTKISAPENKLKMNKFIRLSWRRITWSKKGRSALNRNWPDHDAEPSLNGDSECRRVSDTAATWPYSSACWSASCWLSPSDETWWCAAWYTRQAINLSYHTLDNQLASHIIIIIIRHAPSVRSSACCQ